MINKYLKSLLFEHDCVVLPGFGGFITQYVSAEIHPITHKFQPPSKRVAFNELLLNEDSILMDAIMAGEGLNKEETINTISEYVKAIRSSLEENGNFELKDIGRFYINQDRKLQFETDVAQNFLADSYSLPELFFKPIERNTNTMNKVQRPVKKKEVSDEEYIGANDEEKKINLSLVILPVILLVLGAATAFMYFNKEDKNLASVNPFVIFADQTEEVKKQPEIVKASIETAAAETSEIIEENTAESTESMPEETLTAQQGRFFIVTGSFKSRENALKLREKLEEKNVSATILEPDGSNELYRVSLADFGTKEEAKEKLKELKPSFGKSIWILTY